MIEFLCKRKKLANTLQNVAVAMLIENNYRKVTKTRCKQLASLQ